VAEGGRLDDLLGIVHLRQLLDAEGVAVRGLATESVVLPETLSVLHALRAMQAQRAQMAVVVNEHGGAEGIVTLEDLLEELVGEIWDESDPDVLSVQRLPDGSLVLPGRYPIHDLEDIGVELPEGEYSTVAGLVLDRLGHIPSGPGDAVEVDGWRLEVQGVHQRTITLVRLIGPVPGDVPD
jgi:putative hemolysin